MTVAMSLTDLIVKYLASVTHLIQPDCSTTDEMKSQCAKDKNTVLGEGGKALKLQTRTLKYYTGLKLLKLTLLNGIVNEIN